MFCGRENQGVGGKDTCHFVMINILWWKIARGLTIRSKNKRPGRMTSSSPPCCLLARLFECVRLHSKSYMYICACASVCPRNKPRLNVWKNVPTAQKCGGSVSNFTNERRSEMARTNAQTYSRYN